ncbi:hypothetical protein V8E51_009434 [Hyaloscypha variabilis]
MAYPTLNVKTAQELWDKLTQTGEVGDGPPTTIVQCEAYRDYLVHVKWAGGIIVGLVFAGLLLAIVVWELVRRVTSWNERKLVRKLMKARPEKDEILRERACELWMKVEKEVEVSGEGYRVVEKEDGVWAMGRDV